LSETQRIGKDAACQERKRSIRPLREEHKVLRREERARVGEPPRAHCKKGASTQRAREKKSLRKPTIQSQKGEGEERNGVAAEHSGKTGKTTRAR